MSNNVTPIYQNGSENSITLYNLISPKFAIRGTLGNLAMGHLLQNLEEDLIRWTGEANEKITADTKASTIFKPVSQVAYTKNNRVKLCDGFQSLQCLKLNGCAITFLYNKHRCTTTCSNGCGTDCGCCGNVVTPLLPNCHSFYIDGCWVKFSPDVSDGEKVEIEAWATPKDEEGYVLVIDRTTTALQSYVAWQVCIRQGDNRAPHFEKRWYFECRQARAYINRKTDAELREIAKWWQPRSFYISNGFNSATW